MSRVRASGGQIGTRRGGGAGSKEEVLGVKEGVGGEEEGNGREEEDLDCGAGDIDTSARLTASNLLCVLATDQQWP